MSPSSFYSSESYPFSFFSLLQYIFIHPNGKHKYIQYTQIPPFFILFNQTSRNTTILYSSHFFSQASTISYILNSLQSNFHNCLRSFQSSIHKYLNSPQSSLNKCLHRHLSSFHNYLNSFQSSFHNSLHSLRCLASKNTSIFNSSFFSDNLSQYLHSTILFYQAFTVPLFSILLISSAKLPQNLHSTFLFNQTSTNTSILHSHQPSFN